MQESRSEMAAAAASFRIKYWSRLRLGAVLMQESRSEMAAAAASFRVKHCLRLRLARAGGGANAVVQVRDGSSSSFSPSQALFLPPAGGGTSEVGTQVCGGSSSYVRPSRAPFLHPAE